MIEPRSIVRVIATLAWAFAALPLLVLAQAPGTTQPHLAHLTNGFTDAPGGRGLIVTAAEEVNVAMLHANYAAGDLGNLDAMQEHAGHVLHALDPSQMQQGPGLGFGVIQAAEAIERHVELAMSADGASPAVRTHGPNLLAAAQGVSTRASEMVELGRRVLAAGTPADAAPLVEEMRALALALDTGEGSNLAAGQGGMTHVEAQAYEMLVGERLLRVLR